MQILRECLRKDSRYVNARLGGKDIFASHLSGNVRGHLWECGIDNAPLMLVLPGFTEYCEKYAHIMKHLVSLGFDCLSIDWPGQGRSGHFGNDKLAVHCVDFETQIDSLQSLLEEAGWGSKSFHILGHSMGGHLAILTANRLPEKVLSMALSAPMMQPKQGPVFGVRLLASIFTIAGRWRDFAPFTKIPSLADLSVFDPANSLTNDEAGYAWQSHWFEEAPELRRYGATVGWVASAYRSVAHATKNKNYLKHITTPTLLLAAGEESIVSNQAIRDAASSMPHAALVEIANAKHELLNETPEIDAIIWERLQSFWQGQSVPLIK